MTIGIDLLSFSTSRYFFSLKSLANYRNVEYAKYYSGIGQMKMSVFPPNEDIVTLAIAASKRILTKVDDISSIDMLIFATESSFDLSKSAGIYVHHFLDLKPDCRVFDVKQACYSLTAAIQLAKNYVSAYPESKVLIIGSDIVKYSEESSGEPTQGGAAVAAIISKNPRLMSLEPYSSVYTRDIMDFWRPIYKNDALFDGKLSAQNYLESLKITFEKYLQKSGLKKEDVNYFCFHCPFCKMVKKAARLLSINNVDDTIIYNSIIGNSCSASLYISLISLLDNCPSDLTGKRVGMFSYGSGSVAEFFSGRIAENYRNVLFTEKHQNQLSSRSEISFKEYEAFRMDLPVNCCYENAGHVFLKTIEDDKRIYEILKNQL
ncbi:MAG: hydroxymethylglutaryl-CoA synthase [Alphaproteobacteria bacterium]|nr:hydroxymethylglutaryl-CoA synthase [Alphaproteobacteria bacterium]